MVVRNREREEQAARVVPVVPALDHLGAVRRHELAEVDLQPLPHRREEAGVPLLDVSRNSGPPGSNAFTMSAVWPASKSRRNPTRLSRGRLLLERHLRQREAELVVVDVEVPQQRVDSR